ncbi:MAG: RNA-binding domain-containing protein [Bifidobacterium crudilactis]|uniref:RNA-binding domain-containing protein n=1 Tax=Bifidobacterium crudilactis TaxID=327277 RepID=UPI003F9BDD7B
MSVEFTSDAQSLPDTDILEAVVALANTDGGTVYLGVEDNGTPTGLHRNHRDSTGLAAMTANRTVPSISVRTQIIDTEESSVMEIKVPKSPSVVSTKSGKVLHRLLKIDGTPESVPMYPYEIATRLSDLGRLDISAQPIPDATPNDFDAVERNRLRRIIRSYRSSDHNLLELADDELEKALRFTTTLNGETVPTLTGLLMLGKEEALQRFIPTHEAAFQVLVGTEVRVNQSYHGPLLQIIEQINDMFTPWNSSTELSVGLFSLMVPEFDENAFREAIVNAFGHRDYTLLGRVRIQLDDYGLTISNPGGFVEGINIHNLLTAEPHGRNPCLMDALKRTGLAERTGRGIDRIYEGALHFGRPLPDYSASNERNVSVFQQRSAPDALFVQMLAEEQERSGKGLSINALLILNMLKNDRRCSYDALQEALDINNQRLRAILGQLAESGLIEGSGAGGRRTFTLGSRIYKRRGKAIEYVRQSDIDRIRYQELILKLSSEQGSITKNDVMNLLHLDANQAYYQLSKLIQAGKISKIGSGRNTRYARK